MSRCRRLNIFTVFFSLYLYSCDGQEQSHSESSIEGDNEIITVPDHDNAGAEEINAGTEEVNAGTEEVNAGAEEVNAGAEEINAGSETISSPEPVRPELPVGLDDDFSLKACQVLNLDTVPVIAVSEISEAGQVTILPSEVNAFSVRLPETGVGYITLEVPDWSITVGLFTHFTQSVKDFPLLTSIESDFEFIDSIHRESTITILWRLTSSQFEGEFLGLLTLQTGDTGMEITALSVN